MSDTKTAPITAPEACETMAQVRQGVDALDRELVALMLDQAQRCTGMMAAARERSEWRTAAHTLKGAARGVGAFALGELCDQAEELPEMAWAGAAVQITQCVEQTRQAFGDLAD